MSAKVGYVIAALKANGWVLVRQRGSHRQFKHPRNRHVVTVVGALQETGEPIPVPSNFAGFVAA